MIEDSGERPAQDPNKFAVESFATKVAESVESKLFGINLLSRMQGFQEEKAPTLKQKGYQYQTDFNVKVINMLAEAKRKGSFEEAIDKASAMLRKRNQENVLLDRNPAALKQVESKRAISELTGTSDSSDTKFLALASILAREEPSA
ncbi:Protein CBG23376 [Caenorhabditis briggsae]|uniref:Protein CBG23376 n=1 Tax=Caenorhabditis briggsae TaxID=6238 RepID=A8Y425_CAEBR|nr:Protein CBG23376 [Caenorhabditis briggsae]CAP39645.1 Protein CBG23376 [Caenorhabditis briggsae]